jgi:hypothetical protein
MKAPLPAQSRPNRVLRFLAVVLTAVAVGSVVLVAVDMVVGRPAAGDVYIAFLNSLAAVRCSHGKVEDCSAQRLGHTQPPVQ